MTTPIGLPNGLSNWQQAPRMNGTAFRLNWVRLTVRFSLIDQGEVRWTRYGG